MSSSNRPRALFVSLLLVVGVFAALAVGCGKKEDEPSGNSGYYTGKMQPKGQQPQAGADAVKGDTK